MLNLGLRFASNKNSLHCSGSSIGRVIITVMITRFPAKRGKVRPADKLQVKAAKFLPFVGLARSKQDPINRGHGAQYLYRFPPARANCRSLE